MREFTKKLIEENTKLGKAIHGDKYEMEAEANEDAVRFIIEAERKHAFSLSPNLNAYKVNADHLYSGYGNEKETRMEMDWHTFIFNTYIKGN
ncbi:MAG: hypothetical protein AB9866_18825 [Syntrophobacteraceae bacterium]